MPASNRLFLLLIAAVALALGVGAAVLLQRDAAPMLESGTLLPQARTLPPLQLIDEHGQAFGLAQLQGRWTLVFPGFTYCPDVCPTTLALLKRVRADLGPQAEQLQVLLLSVDPERDTPERLQRYVAQFDPSFKAVTAEPEQLRQAAQALGIAYAKVAGDAPGNYQVDHSAALVLLDPQARLAGYLTPPHRAESIAADLKQLFGRP